MTLPSPERIITLSLTTSIVCSKVFDNLFQPAFISSCLNGKKIVLK